MDQDAWNLNPKLRPDIFTADRTRKTKWVTFYTDIDSIRVKVKPGSQFDFIVLLNGKDSCYTRISSAITPPEKSTRKTHDTIPFTISAFKAIHVRAIINGTDTLSFHFDIGAFDFRFTNNGLRKVAGLFGPNDSSNSQTNRAALKKIRRIQMGSLVWDSAQTGITSVTSTGMDGRFGWNLFENKIVEIDGDRGLLIIHSELDHSAHGYHKAKLEFIRSFVCMQAAFKVRGHNCKGAFLFDTGSDQAIILDSNWAAVNHFPTDLRLLKTSVIRDPRGVKYETKLVVAPPLLVNGFTIEKIPTLMLGSKSPLGFTVNYFGNDLLKRFNLIFDFRNDYVYMKPNQLYSTKFREQS